jgi:hypothetical protein
MTRVLFASVLVLSATVSACATSDSCSIDRECPTLHYCSAGTCRQDCTRDSTCGAGFCTSTGRCVAADEDAGEPRDSGADVAMTLGPDGGLDAAALSGLDGGPRPDAHLPPGDDAFLAAPDALVGADAPLDGFVAPDAFVTPDASGPRDAGRDAGAGPLRPSTYTYTRVAVGGLGDAHVVAFHPDGSYAIVLERSNDVHVYDWASGTAMRFDVRVGSRNVQLDDLVLSHDGTTAWIVGYERVGTTDTGILIAFSDAAYRRGEGLASFTRSATTVSGERLSGIEIPRAPSGGPGGGRPVVLSQSGSSSFIARLRELDPATGMFGGLFVARATSAGCDDLAFSNNEFGAWGIVVACGSSGADMPYYTEIAGVGEWRASGGSLGNVSRADGHPSGAYALVPNWSSGSLRRHEAGALLGSSASPGLAGTVWDVSFSAEGRLALVTGRAGGSPLRGTIYEYRHDLYSVAEITDVSIEGFGGPPYSATSSTYLNDSAFRPGCDGGLLVAGNSSAGTGMVIEFQRTDGTRCR